MLSEVQEIREPKSALEAGEFVYLSLSWVLYEGKYGWQMTSIVGKRHYILARFSPTPPPGMLCRFEVVKTVQSHIGETVFVRFSGLRKATPEEVASARNQQQQR